MKNIFLFLISSVIVGCGPMSLFDDGVSTEQFKAVDGVKLIDANIDNPRAAQTYSQGEYTIGPSSRLLVRFLNMTELVQRIRTQDGPVSLQVTVVNPLEREEALDHIKVYPILRDWSMLATWTRIVPWGGGENAWLTPGGDFETEKVYVATPTKPVYPQPSLRSGRNANTIVPTSTNDALYFDVTDWYLNFPKGKSQFFGLILVSDVPFRIYGDYGSQGPKLHFID